MGCSDSRLSKPLFHRRVRCVYSANHEDVRAASFEVCVSWPLSWSQLIEAAEQVKPFPKYLVGAREDEMCVGIFADGRAVGHAISNSWIVPVHRLHKKHILVIDYLAPSTIARGTQEPKPMLDDHCPNGGELILSERKTTWFCDQCGCDQLSNTMSYRCACCPRLDYCEECVVNARSLTVAKSVAPIMLVPPPLPPPA